MEIRIHLVIIRSTVCDILWMFVGLVDLAGCLATTGKSLKKAAMAELLSMMIQSTAGKMDWIICVHA